jgi:hypothetical protein
LRGAAAADYGGGCLGPGFAAKREVRGRKPVSAADVIQGGRTGGNGRLTRTASVGLQVIVAILSASRDAGACGRLGSCIPRGAAPRTSQGEDREKRFEKILSQEPDRWNRDAVAHQAKGLIDVRRQLVFVREPHQAGGLARRQ